MSSGQNDDKTAKHLSDSEKIAKEIEELERQKSQLEKQRDEGDIRKAKSIQDKFKPTPRPNKKFLSNLLKNTVSHNNRLIETQKKKADEMQQKALSNDLIKPKDSDTKTKEETNGDLKEDKSLKRNFDSKDAFQEGNKKKREDSPER